MPFFVTPDGCRLFYKSIDSSPDKPFLVCLNGTMQSALQWVPIARKLGQDFNVLLFDGRAQGRSDLGDLPLGIDRHTLDLLGLMRRLGIETAHLVGLSHGAVIAMALAAQHPERVNRLVLCSIGHMGTTRSRAMITSWVEILRRCHTEAFAWAVLPHLFGGEYLDRQWPRMAKMAHAIAARNQYPALITHLKSMLQYPQPWPCIDQVQSPCLLISGSEDALVTDTTARSLAEQLKATHHVLDGIGHTVPVEAPDRFVALIRSFFRQATPQ